MPLIFPNYFEKPLIKVDNKFRDNYLTDFDDTASLSTHTKYLHANWARIYIYRVSHLKNARLLSRKWCQIEDHYNVPKLLSVEGDV